MAAFVQAKSLRVFLYKNISLDKHSSLYLWLACNETLSHVKIYSRNFIWL